MRVSLLGACAHSDKFLSIMSVLAANHPIAHGTRIEGTRECRGALVTSLAVLKHTGHTLEAKLKALARTLIRNLFFLQSSFKKHANSDSIVWSPGLCCRPTLLTSGAFSRGYWHRYLSMGSPNSRSSRIRRPRHNVRAGYPRTPRHVHCEYKAET